MFLPHATEIGARKRELCARFGIEGLFPLDAELEAGADATQIFRANHALIERADAGIFNLTPFRGPSADAGTVFELGFMVALGKPVWGYTSDPSSYLERVREQLGPLARSSEGWRDRNGHAVEDFGLHDNLMIAVSITDSGFCVYAVPEEGPDALAALRAFEAGVAQIAAGPIGRNSEEGRHVRGCVHDRG